MDKAVVLLSGGMDSATALYWAAERYDIAAIMNFDYGQRGAQKEANSAALLLGTLKVQEKIDEHLGILKVTLRIPVVSSLTSHDLSLNPVIKDRHGQPLSFVPGRNMIFISYATTVAYDVGAKYIIGGWSSLDVDYPDCSIGFLNAASAASALAIGRRCTELSVMSPVISITKAETVGLGMELGVPWKHTRSCYASDDEPCLVCDSCILRVKAFITAGVRDPTVDDARWVAQRENFKRIYGGTNATSE